MSAARQYLRGIHDRFDLLATWPLDEKLNLGDVGLLARGRFFLRTTLSALNVDFRTRPSSGSSNWDHMSGANLSVELQAGEEATSEAVGHAVVTFGTSGAFLFQVRDAMTDVIEDMAKVAVELLYQYRGGAFERDWVVVDSSGVRQERNNIHLRIKEGSPGAPREPGADIDRVAR